MTMTWIFPTENSEYEVDLRHYRARQIRGEHTTECFTPQGDWRDFETLRLGIDAQLTFSWADPAPSRWTKTSPVRLDEIRAG